MGVNAKILHFWEKTAKKILRFREKVTKKILHFREFCRN